MLSSALIEMPARRNLGHGLLRTGASGVRTMISSDWQIQG
jgi:hypothetical protein